MTTEDNPPAAPPLTRREELTSEYLLGLLDLKAGIDGSGFAYDHPCGTPTTLGMYQPWYPAEAFGLTLAADESATEMSRFVFCEKSHDWLKGGRRE